MTTDEKANEQAANLVTTPRKLFDITVGAAIPLVLSLFIGIVDRVSDLEHYRSLDQYRMDEFTTWRHSGDYQDTERHLQSMVQLVGQLVERSRLCDNRVRRLENTLPSARQNGKAIE